MKLHGDKLSTNLPDLYSLQSILPDHLRDNDRFNEFLEAYFEWQQKDAISPANIINKLVDARNIDEIADEFFRYIQHEVAASIPNIQGVDKRKLYKHLSDLYLSKGSLPSYEALFNLLFQDEIELYFPRVDMLKPSEGSWDNTNARYLDNNGFLSDRKFIQDSYYYQDYSYVIKTSKTVDVWKDIVTKVLHPAGFAFFGQVKIVSSAIKQILKAPLIQPGSREGQKPLIPVIIDKVQSTISAPLTTSYIRINGNAAMNSVFSRQTIPFGPTYKHLDEYKFVQKYPVPANPLLASINDVSGFPDNISSYLNVVLANVEGVNGVIDEDTGKYPYTLKTNIVPGSLNIGLSGEYVYSSITLSKFIMVQPADLASNSYDETIDLTEPTSVSPEEDLMDN